MKVRPSVRSVCACVLAFAACAGVASACSGAEPTANYFNGSDLGYCSGFQVQEIRAAECGHQEGGVNCPGTTAYALCNGTSYTECTCEIPAGYSLDGGVVDSGLSPQVNGVVPFSGDTPPCCGGNVLFEIPGPECSLANCRGNVAYAVCQGGAYSGCACDPPDGYAAPNDAAPCADH